MQQDRLSSDLNKIWKLRNNRQIDTCKTSFRDFLEAWDERKFPQFHESVQLLKASLLRADGHYPESQQILESVWTKSKSASLYLQLGLNSYGQGNLIHALEFFQKVIRIGKNPIEKTMALVNTLLCHESLGIPCDKHLTLLKENLAHISSEELPADVLAQYEAFELRALFRKGDFASLEPRLALTTSANFQQKDYYQLWLIGHPHTKGSRKKLLSYFEFLTSKNSDLYFKNFRWNTLFGRIEEADFQNIKISELVDRLYLWTWWWINDEMNVSSVLITLEQILEHKSRGKLTVEDYQLLRNSLYWLEFFHRDFSASAILALVPNSSISDYPIFQEEFKIVSQLILQKRGSNSKISKAKISFPWQAQNIFCDKISDILPQINKDKFSIFVDLNCDLVRVESKQTIITSYSIAQFFYLISRDPNPSFATILEKSFSIHPYDSAIHGAKIHNFLLKIKKILPASFTLFTREQKVHVNFIPSQLQIKGQFAASQNYAFAQFYSSKEKTFAKKTSAQVLQEKFPEKFTRADLQGALAISKAATNRYLINLLEKKYIHKTGVGKGTTYCFIKKDLR